MKLLNVRTVNYVQLPKDQACYFLLEGPQAVDSITLVGTYVLVVKGSTQVIIPLPNVAYATVLIEPPQPIERVKPNGKAK